MPRNAVTHFAEAREINEQPLLEKRWQRIVQVGELGESPQIGRDLRILWNQAKEVGQYTETLFNLVFQCSPLLRDGSPAALR